MITDTEPLSTNIPPSGEQEVKMTHQFVILPDNFDHMISQDTSVRDEIAGVLTVSLRHVIKSVQGYSVPTFTEDQIGESQIPSVNLDLAPDVYLSYFGNQPLATTIENLITQNREHGLRGSINDIIMREPYAPTSHHRIGEEERLDIIEDLVKQSRALTPEELLERLDNLSSKESEILYSLFPGKEELVKLILSARQRGGVQLVITDKEKLIDYLRRHGASVNDDWAAILHAPVPAELIKFVIPLGTYEQSSL